MTMLSIVVPPTTRSGRLEDCAALPRPFLRAAQLSKQRQGRERQFSSARIAGAPRDTSSSDC